MHLDLPVFNTVDEAMKAVQVKTLVLEFLNNDSCWCTKIVEPSGSVDELKTMISHSLMPL